VKEDEDVGETSWVLS